MTIRDEQTIRKMLYIIGDEPDREGLKDTPDRVLRMWKELFIGYNISAKPKITVFDNGKDGILYDEMICDEGPFHSMCEHHLMPIINGRYYFAYIPHLKGKILGLSKVARVVDYFSAKLQVQERLTHEIIDYLYYGISTEDIRPLGIGLVMEAEHLCKSMRGAKKEGRMRTTVLRGCFKTDAKARSEFLSWVNKK